MSDNQDLTKRIYDHDLRRFYLWRDVDETGISGTGMIAFGVEFPDGTVVTQWNSEISQVSVWKSMEEVIAIHGHGGSTKVHWIDT